MKKATKSAKRLLAMALLIICVVSALIIPACAEPTTNQLIRYVPTSYTVTDNTIVVEGYFVNMTKDQIVGNFTDFQLDVYEGDSRLFGGTFGNLHSFLVYPQSVQQETLTIHFSNGTPLYPGTYDCDDNVYASFSAGYNVW